MAFFLGYISAYNYSEKKASVEKKMLNFNVCCCILSGEVVKVARKVVVVRLDKETEDWIASVAVEGNVSQWIRLLVEERKQQCLNQNLKPTSE